MGRGSEVSFLHSTAVLKAAEIRTESILCEHNRVRVCDSFQPLAKQDTVKPDQLESYDSTASQTLTKF